MAWVLDTDLCQQVVADLGDLACVLRSLLISTGHKNERELFILTHFLPLLFDQMMALSALKLRLALLDLRDLFTPEKSVSSEEPQLASRLDRVVLTALLKKVDLSSKLILLYFSVLFKLEVAFARLLGHLMELSSLSV
jgi:hypothetical protein